MSDNSTPVSRMLHEDEAELNRLAEFGAGADRPMVAEWIRALAVAQRCADHINVQAFQQWMRFADRLDPK